MPAALSLPSGPETILIVDDEPANLKILATILGDKGYRVIAASNGETALRLAERPPLPSLILLDVMMPDMSGMVVLEKLRENPATRTIPVVMVTALGKERDEEIGLQAGASDYIKKPFSPLILLARVRTQLDAARLRALLRNELQREKQLRDLEGDLMQTVVIRALAHLAETRDLETGNHILRTQKYVRVLAEDLRTHGWDLSDSTISLLERSAPLHDIGKVGIPDEVLLKKGKLTPDEWVTMKKHARIGADAITRAEEDVQQEMRQRWHDGEIDDKTRDLLDCLRIAKEIAHRHHERWDGSGYPDGLAGEAIPRSARLMALADVFDALISKRCYKEAWDYGHARATILEGRGTHFDPAVVEAFERCYDEFCRIATTFADPKEEPGNAVDRGA